MVMLKILLLFHFTKLKGLFFWPVDFYRATSAPKVKVLMGKQFINAICSSFWGKFYGRVLTFLFQQWGKDRNIQRCSILILPFSDSVLQRKTIYGWRDAQKSIYNSYQNDHLMFFYHSMLFIWSNPNSHNCHQSKCVPE